jgi:type IV pilus assembly PilX-like protein
MRRDRGFALVVAIIAVALLSALGLALALVTSTEMLIAANYAAVHELTYVAEGGLEIAEQELRRVPDWNAVLAGLIQSTWADRVSPMVNEATNIANCGKLTACTAAEMDAVSDLRPWGANNPRWQLFAFGPLNGSYVVAWVSDDAAENDGDPLRDGVAGENPGAGVVAVRSEAFGVGGGHKVVESTVRRSGAGDGISRLSWAEIR